MSESKGEYVERVGVRKGKVKRSRGEAELCERVCLSVSGTGKWVTMWIVNSFIMNDSGVGGGDPETRSVGADTLLEETDKWRIWFWKQ